MLPVIHEITAPDWYATQVGQSVEIRSRGTEAVLTTLTPPTEWGRDWGWNITPDGQGIVFMKMPSRGLVFRSASAVPGDLG